MPDVLPNVPVGVPFQRSKITCFGDCVVTTSPPPGIADFDKKNSTVDPLTPPRDKLLVLFDPFYKKKWKRQSPNVAPLESG